MNQFHNTPDGKKNNNKKVETIESLANAMYNVSPRKLHQSVRNGGGALIANKNVRKTVGMWTPSQPSRAWVAKKATANATEQMVGWFNNVFPGGLNALCSDSFDVSYNIYGDMARDNVYGENTLGMEVNVEWEYCPVDIITYSGVSSATRINPTLSPSLSNGAREISNLAKGTGLQTNDVKALGQRDVDKLLNIFSIGSCGQNKLGRIVKGCMIYFDLLESGKKRFDIQLNSLEYTTTDLLRYHGDEAAYVWSEYPSNSIYTTAIYLMSIAYPNAYTGGRKHVNMAADGKDVYVVSRGLFGSVLKDVQLTHLTMWSALVTYVDDLSCGDILHEAMVIASAIRENKYFTTMSLPNVVSYIDLIKPALELGALGIKGKPFMSTELSVSIGRVHQMLAFNLTKDAITAAIESTSSKGNAFNTIQKYITTQSATFLRNGDSNSDLRILEAAGKLRFLDHLSIDDLAALSNTPLLESLWLVNTIESIFKGGAVDTFKNGTKDRMGAYRKAGIYKNHVLELRAEIAIAGCSFDTKVLPEGDWTMDACYLRKGTKKMRVAKVWKTEKCGYSNDKQVISAELPQNTSILPHNISRSKNNRGIVSKATAQFGNTQQSQQCTSKAEDDSPAAQVNVEGTQDRVIEDVTLEEVIETATEAESIRQQDGGTNHTVLTQDLLLSEFNVMDNELKELLKPMFTDSSFMNGTVYNIMLRDLAAVKRHKNWYEVSSTDPVIMTYITRGRNMSVNEEGVDIAGMSDLELVLKYKKEYKGLIGEHLKGSFKHLINNPRLLNVCGLADDDWRRAICVKYLDAGGKLAGWKVIRGILGSTPINPLLTSDIKSDLFVDKEPGLSGYWSRNKDKVDLRPMTSMRKDEGIKRHDRLVVLMSTFIGEPMFDKAGYDLIKRNFIIEQGLNSIFEKVAGRSKNRR